MRLDRLNVINDYAQNLSVVSVDGLNYLFQIGICCGIMLYNQHNTVRLLNQRKRVDYDTNGRSIENDIIKLLFKLHDKLLHTLTGEKLGGVRRNGAVGNRIKIIDF